MTKKLTILLLGLFVLFLYTESLLYAQESGGGGIDYLASIKKAKKEVSIPIKFAYQQDAGKSSDSSTVTTVNDDDTEIGFNNPEGDPEINTDAEDMANNDILPGDGGETDHIVKDPLGEDDTTP